MTGTTISQEQLDMWKIERIVINTKKSKNEKWNLFKVGNLEFNKIRDEIAEKLVFLRGEINDIVVDNGRKEIQIKLLMNYHFCLRNFYIDFIEKVYNPIVKMDQQYDKMRDEAQEEINQLLNPVSEDVRCYGMAQYGHELELNL